MHRGACRSILAYSPAAASQSQFRSSPPRGKSELTHLQLNIYARATLASAAFWAFDRILRLLNRCYQSFRPKEGGVARASISVLTKEIVRLRITMPASRIVLPTKCHSETAPSVPARIAAGQSIGLTIPCLQWMGDHPFTVMATGMDEEQAGMGYLDLAIKANGGLTKKLAELLHVDLEQEDLENAKVAPPSLAVLVEGPYGSLHEEVSTLPAPSRHYLTTV